MPQTLKLSLFDQPALERAHHLHTESLEETSTPLPGNHHDGFVVGALVRSTINPELVGHIVSLGLSHVETLSGEAVEDTTQAQVQLITFPTPFWARWSKRPVPFLVRNLELIMEDELEENNPAKEGETHENLVQARGVHRGGGR